MNDALRMQVSAFVDGELPENETELLLRRLSQDAALRQLVGQYLAIGRLVRHEREIPGMSDLRSRIASALGEEQPIDAVPAAEASRSRFVKPAAGFAIAGSVAILALAGLRQVDAPADNPANNPTMQAAAEADTGYTEPRPSDVLPGRPSETLMQYYLRHGETSADLGANGILTRLVTLDLRHGELVEVEPVNNKMDVDGGNRIATPQSRTGDEPRSQTGDHPQSQSGDEQLQQ